jgi:hypothetical protein
MMAENDSNTIKPVEGFQNIAGLTPTKRREQRKRRQHLWQHRSDQRLNDQPESVEARDETNENEQDQQQSIDYRA